MRISCIAVSMYMLFMNLIALVFMLRTTAQSNRRYYNKEKFLHSNQVSNQKLKTGYFQKL